MGRHPWKLILLILSLGTGLHFTFRGLAGELPLVFPHLRTVSDSSISEPLPLPEKIEEPSFEKVLSPSSNETLPPQPVLHPLRVSRRLVPSGTPVNLPLLREGGLHTSFETPPALEFAVDFWKKIYAIYDTKHVVIHDTDFLNIQYSVLDFTDLSQKDISEIEKKSIRDDKVNEEIDRIKNTLLELSQASSDLSLDLSLSPQAKRIAQLFEAIDDPDKYKKAMDRIRSQTGLRDRFLEGLQHSGRYMPLFESIFQSHGVPQEISRLAFVESLFRENAYSKVGAAGLWQFMPSSARRYMNVDRLLDERYDPLVATHGAARLLLRNYETLGTWPLAINAYNSGAGNLLKAISKLGTRDIATIITYYRNGSYAFASRNFYPSFLAALDIYENYEHYFGRVGRDPLLQFDLVQLPATMGFEEVAYLSSTSLQDLKELNPAFTPKAFEGNYAIPAGSQIRIPRGVRTLFAARFIDLYSGTESPQWHVVQANENLQTIAKKYDLSPHDLQKVNITPSLNDGQVLLIPKTTNMVSNFQ